MSHTSPSAEICSVSEYAESAYLQYAMYVILDRALPHICDGLKPVQRRIIYAMSELGLGSTAKYKKSARTVGDVIGKFHPHGDSACYEAMVLLAQDFVCRYPLIDGQGNWGSLDDPKSFAAMRYTESRLTRYADLLLQELPQGTVEWVANFDGTVQEPVLLPAQVPNILLGGLSGIAVGMATDIPPHNLSELVQACMLLLESPKATVEELCTCLPAPDFPTGGEIITPPEELLEIYRTGSGSVQLRATWQAEKQNIVITELPWQCSSSRILQQIDSQCQKKQLPMLAGVRDESDYNNPVRLVLFPGSRRVDKEELMSHLYATTDLERSCRVNLNMIGIDGRPQVKDLRTILKEWLDFRTATVRRRLQYQQEKLAAKIHRLEGLLIAHLHLDAVIAIIRHEEDAAAVLMKRFHISETQAEAILELRLRKLAKLEEIRLQSELTELQQEMQQVEKTLSSPRRLKTLLKKELQAVQQQFSDPRRSLLVQRAAAKTIAVASTIAAEPVTVILSTQGWLRAAKGHEVDPAALSYREGDSFLHAARGKSNQLVNLLDSTGRSYCVPASVLPSARSFGEPASAHSNPPDGTRFVSVLCGDSATQVLLGSSFGYGFITTIADLQTRNRNGKVVLTVATAASALATVAVSDVSQDQVAVVSSSGYLLLFPAAELPVMAKGKGLKMMNIPSASLRAQKECVVAVTILPPRHTLMLRSGQRDWCLKPNELAVYSGQRGRRGRLLPRGFRQVHTLWASDGSR